MLVNLIIPDGNPNCILLNIELLIKAEKTFLGEYSGNLISLVNKLRDANEKIEAQLTLTNYQSNNSLGKIEIGRANNERKSNSTFLLWPEGNCTQNKENDSSDEENYKSDKLH